MITQQLKPIEHEGVRVITTDLLAQVYETDASNIKVNFNRNKGNFKEGIHYFLLKGSTLKAFKDLMSDDNLIDKRSPHLYLWTERGASRHCKILDTPKAWEQFDNLEETYFAVKEQRKIPQKTQAEIDASCKRASAQLLNAQHRTVSLLTSLWDRAGVKPEYQAIALVNFYETGVISLPSIALQEAKITYGKGTIAKKLGVYSAASKGTKTHAQAIGAIISELDIGPDEQELVPFSKNGHDGTDYQYTESVIEKVRAWLDERDRPCFINAGGKKFEVMYKEPKA